MTAAATEHGRSVSGEARSFPLAVLGKPGPPGPAPSLVHSCRAAPFKGLSSKKKKKLKMTFYSCTGIKTNRLIYVNIFFDLKFHFFLLILKEMTTFLCPLQVSQPRYRSRCASWSGWPQPSPGPGGSARERPQSLKVLPQEGPRARRSHFASSDLLCQPAGGLLASPIRHGWLRLGAAAGTPGCPGWAWGPA